MEKNNEVVTNKPVKTERMNIYVFSILMFIVFVATFYVVHIYLRSFLFSNVFSNMHTYDIIGEAILAILAFVVLLFWKNSYVFTQKQEKFIPSLRYGWFYLIMGVVFFGLYGSASMNNVPGVINTAIFALLVGIYEEFLCRGWLLNEFLERYGETKKGVWVSIIASGVIFGLIHFINVSSNGFAGTVTQVLSASASGILFGFIYYRTKNIWSVVFLHAYWDFMLFLAQLSPVTSVSANISGTTVLAIIGSILLVLSELIIFLPFRKDVDKNVENKSLVKYGAIASGAYFVSFIISALGLVSTGIKEYEIGNLAIDEYSVIYDNYETYDIKKEVEIADELGVYTTENYSFSLYKTDSLLVFKNNTTGESVNFDFNSLYDYSLYEFKDYYLIAYVNLDKDGNAEFRYHYLYKSELSNENSYLHEVKNNGSMHLISDVGELCIVHNKETAYEYMAVKTDDYGYFVLEEQDKVSILNRD